MAPLALMVPPTVVLKEKVAETDDFMAIRSVSAMANDSMVGWDPMRPLGAPAERTVSELVAIRTPKGLSAVGLPIMRLETVTVTNVFALIDAAAFKVTTIALAVGVEADAVPVTPVPPLIETAGAPAGAKKPGG